MPLIVTDCGSILGVLGVTPVLLVGVLMQNGTPVLCERTRSAADFSTERGGVVTHREGSSDAIALFY